MKIKVYAEGPVVGSDRSDEIEVDDDATDEEIDEEVRDWFFNHYNYSWVKVED